MDAARFELHWIDYAIVVVYFIGVIGHGLWVSRGKETSKDYFLAGGKLPWYLIGFSLYASNMSGSSFVGTMGGAYDNGIAIFNWEWTAVVVLIFFAIFILPSFLRAEIYTVPEFLEKRYDGRARRAFSIFTLLAIMFIDTAGALYAGGLVIANIVPALNLWTATALLALVAGVYTILGGLGAVVVTDTVQAILLMIGGAVLCWLGLQEVGGWSALFEGTPDAKSHLILPATDDFIPWTGIWGVILLGFYYFGINQFVVQRTLGAKSLQQGQLGAVFAGFLKLPNLFILIIPGLIALQLYPDLETPDLAFPSLAFDMLPIGLRGLIAAALIAAIMSSLDSALNAAGTLVVRDFIVVAKPDTSQDAQVRYGRIATGAAMVIGAAFAPLIANFESLFEYFQSSLSYVVPPIVVVFVLGLFMPRLNGFGAFWTILLGLVAGVPLFIAKEVTSIWTDAGLPEIHFTIMSTIMMAVGAVMLIVLSRFGERPDPEAVDKIDWNAEDLRNEFGQIYSPWWMDFKIQGGFLIALTVAMLIWFW
jgi:SSS family solute:Na+ symporter